MGGAAWLGGLARRGAIAWSRGITWGGPVTSLGAVAWLAGVAWLGGVQAPGVGGLELTSWRGVRSAPVGRAGARHWSRAHAAMTQRKGAHAAFETAK